MDASIVVRLINETQAGFSKIQTDLRSVDSSTKSVERTFNSAKAALSGLVAVFAGNEVLKFVDSIQTLDNRLKLVTGSQAELNTRFDQLFEVAQRTRAPLGETVDLYSKLAQNQKVVGQTGEGVTKVVEAFNTAMAISGTSGAAAAGAITQFAQAMASGKFQGDEFRSIAEAVPKVLEVISQKTGIAREDLKKLASDGLLNAKVVTQALVEALPELQAELGKTSMTVSQAITVMSNEFRRLGREYLENTGLAEGMVKAIRFIGDNAENIIPILKVLGVVVLALAAYFAPVVTAVVAGTTALIAFADVIGPVLRPVVDAAEKALGGLVGTIIGFGAAVKAAIKLENPFEAFDKATKEYSKSASDATKKSEDLSKATTTLSGETKKALVPTAEMKKRMDEAGLSTALTKNAYTDFIDTLKDSVELSRLDSKEREVQAKVLKALEAEAKRVGRSVSDISAQRRKDIEDEVRSLVTLTQAEEKATSDRKRLADELLRRQEQNMTDEQRIRKAIADINKSYDDIIAANKKANADEILRITQQRDKALQDQLQIFQEDEKAKIRAYQESVKTEVQRYNDELLNLEARFRAMNLEGSDLYFQAREALQAKYGQKYVEEAKRIREEERTALETYNQRIQELEAAANDGRIKDQSVFDAHRRKIEKDYREATVQEYSTLYGALHEKIVGFTGLNQKEFGILRDTVKMVFGVDINTIIKEGFATMVRYVLGFRESATGDINGVGGVIQGLFMPGGTGTQAVGGFASTALQLLGGMRDGIYGVFSWIGTGIAGLFGASGSSTTLMKTFSTSIFDVFKNMGTSVGGIFSSLLTTITGLFSGGSSSNALGLINSFTNTARNAFSGFGSFVTQVFTTMGSGIYSTLSSIASWIGSSLLPALGSVISRALEAISNLTRMSSLGGGGGGSFWSSVVSIGSAIFSWLSDARMKKNIQYAGNYNGINLYDFEYKAPYSTAFGNDRKRGVLAQEVMKMYPNAVSTGSNGMYMVDYSQLGIPHNLLKFAKGGVVNSPMLFGMAGEAGPEAILPLSRTANGDLGVTADFAGGGDTININFTVNAVDAKDFESLLVEKRQFITNMVRASVAEKGRSLI